LTGTVQASSEHYQGLWVISLQHLHDDERAHDGILIYASSQHSALLSSVWQAQKGINPSRDWSAPVVRPDAVIHAAAADREETLTDCKDGDSTARIEVSFNVGMMCCTLLKENETKRVDANSCLLDLCVSELSGSVLSQDTQFLTSAHVLKVHVTGSGKGDYTLLSQLASDNTTVLSQLAKEATVAVSPSLQSASGQGRDREVPCFGMHITSKPGTATACKIQMPKAFSLSIDPQTVAAFTTLQARVSDVWRNLRKTSAGAPVAPEASLPSSQTDATKLACGSSALMVMEAIGLVPDQCLVPDQEGRDKLAGEKGQRMRMSTTLEAVGLHVLLIDAGYQELMLLKMQSVSLVKTDFADGKTAVAGTLGKLEVVDSSSPSVHPKFMTVSEEADALVQVNVELYDQTSVGYQESCENLWQVKIFRPRITLLWRFIGEILQYQRSFSSTPAASTNAPACPTAPTTDDDLASPCSKAAAEARAMPTVPSLSTADLETSGAGDTPGAVQVGPKKRGTLVKISLEHPEVILPRNSTCPDAFYADLGRIDVERASLHSSEKWSVSFKETHLDSVHSSPSSGGVVKMPCVHDLHGSVAIKFCETGAATGEPDMSVDIHLDTLRGSITDQQYALIMSIMGENFTEKRAEDAGFSSPYKPIKRHISHLAEDGTLGDKLGAIIDLARGLTAHRVPSSAYNVTIRDIELAFNRTKPYGASADPQSDSETRDIHPLLHAKAADLKVRYEAFANQPTDGGAALQGLDSSCTAELSRFEFVDTRTCAVHKSEPLFCVRRAVGSANSDLQQERAAAAADDEGNGLEGDTLILFQTFRLSQGHMGIDLMLRDVDTVFDIGLLMSAINFLGTSNGPPVDRGGFTYVVNRAGGFRVQTDLPNSSIRLVTAFDRADADGFDMNGSLSVTYASSASEDVLHVKAEDLVLKVHDSEGAGAKSNHNIDLVRPCSVMASWQWYRKLDRVTLETMAELLEAEHKRRPKFFFAASDMRAMITYENMMLAMRVYSCMISTLANSSSSAQAAPESPAKLEAAARNAKEDTKETETSKEEVELRIQGSGIMLTLIDDFEGRWIPLVRVGLPKVSTNGNSSAMDIQLISARLDYFHGPTSSWKAAVEDAEMSVRYLDWEDGGTRQLQVQIDAQDALMAHLSRAAIDSCRSALQAWSHDGRTWGTDADKDANPLLKSTSQNSLVHSRGSESRDGHAFVPYTVQVEILKSKVPMEFTV
jgi:hypothetical protein